MDIYKSARLIAASGKLKKNKGIMLIGAASATVEFQGISGQAWISTGPLGVTGLTGTVTVIPVAVYGITLGSGSILELN